MALLVIVLTNLKNRGGSICILKVNIYYYTIIDLDVPILQHMLMYKVIIKQYITFVSISRSSKSLAVSMEPRISLYRKKIEYQRPPPHPTWTVVFIRRC